LPQTFSAKFDQYLRLGCLILSALLLLITLVVMGCVRSSWVTGETFSPAQPVQFSHRHHAGQLEIDCRYCHVSVETSDKAGLPSTQTCMTCHSELYTDAEILKPIRESWANDRPVRWTRVLELPDFVYFSHQVHVKNGVACTECHGRVDRMPLTSQSERYTMGWCLECHREPSGRLRPAEQVFEPQWEPPHKQRDRIAEHLMTKYQISLTRLTECTSCHR
jgi:cytochrome c7-like protein/class III cytochrome C family protein